MSDGARKLDGILIFADESSEWRCAGLRQIDRLLLDLNESLGGADDVYPVPVCISWVAAHSRNSSLQGVKLTRLFVTEDFAQFSTQMRGDDACVAVLSTRLVPNRDSAARSWLIGNDGPALLLSGATFTNDDAQKKQLLEQARETERAAWERTQKFPEASSWFYLESASELKTCEDRLLRGTGKSQDGFVSRVFNRPISRAVSKRLVRLPLLPNHWTLLLMTIPLLGATFLLRGDYFGFALGAILFQLHSALDGCDGEIARVKYQESASGRKLDQVCDRSATLIYAVCLGIGLSHQPGITDGMRWFYGLEGMLAATLIGVSETLLTRTPMDQDPSLFENDDRYPQYVRANRQSFNQGDQLKLWMIKNSGMLFAGERATSVFAEATKRDVFNFGFMILALCGRASWILHILAVSGCAIMVLMLKNMFVPKSPR